MPGKKLLIETIVVLLLSNSAIAQVGHTYHDGLLHIILPLCGGSETIGIDVPRGYKMTHINNIDFDLFTFTPISKPAKSNGSMTIYIGHHPAPRHPTHAAKRLIRLQSGTATLYIWKERRGKAAVFVREILFYGLFPFPELRPSIVGGWRYVFPDLPPLPPRIGVPWFQTAPTCVQGAVVHVYIAGLNKRAVDALMETSTTLRKRID